MAGREVCETFQHCESSSSEKGIEENRKRKSECMTEHSSLIWGWGFIGSDATDPSVLAEHEDHFLSGYHSAETEVVTDSDDDLFFLEEATLTSNQVQENGDNNEHVWEAEEVEWWEEEELWEQEEEEEEDEDEDDDEEAESEEEESEEAESEEEESEEAESEEEEDEEELDLEVEKGAFPPDLCVICLTEPRNASFVHGRTGHQVCCIECAERLKKDKGKCPVCRKKIKFVVKNYF